MRTFELVRIVVITALMLSCMPGMATPALASCGDGIVDLDEACDDGNTDQDDGCSGSCALEQCWTCAGEPSACAPDDGAACDDGVFCNGVDSCAAGSCGAHTGDPCPGPDADGDCSEACNESADACTAPDSNGSACDDGLFCTGLDFCSGGSCGAHTNDPCPGADGDGDCAESCDEATDACTGADPDGTACDDGLFCTGVDRCAAGLCDDHPGPPCPGPDGDADCQESCDEGTATCTATDPDGSACSDGSFCTVADACNAGTCGGASRDCNAVGDQCNEGVCDENADLCVGPPKPVGTPCDDDSACTGPDTCDGDGTCTGPPDTAACLDPFLCYKSTRAAGSAVFAQVTNVTLTDQFRTSTVSVIKPRRLCAPADADGTAPEAPAHADHLEDYQIKPVFSFVGGGNRTITNQFGTVVIELQKPIGLLEPTLASVTTPPGPLAVPAVDHFQCYTVKVAPSAPRFERFTIPVTDRFGARVFVIMKPRRLCAPVNEDGGQPGAEMHPNHLLCYQVKEISEPKFVRVTPIFVHSPFGPEAVGAGKPAEICVPSTKAP